MTGPGPHLLALLLVIAGIGAGCTQDPGEPDPEAVLTGCSWASRFTDGSAYEPLSELPRNRPGYEVDHLTSRFGYLPFENETLEPRHGPLRLTRVLHAGTDPAIANPTVTLSHWQVPTPQSALADPVKAGFRVESQEKHVRSYGDDAFVAHVTGNSSEARGPLVAFLGQVTGAPESNRTAWADQALENRTPVEGEPYDRVEITFENFDSDVMSPHEVDRNLTLATLHKELTTEAPTNVNREPGRLVVEVADWWWVFEIDRYRAEVEAGDDGLETHLVVDRDGEAGARVHGPGPTPQADLQQALADAYGTLGLGPAPNATFHTVDQGPACPGGP